jgi:hypothetical protein
MIPIKFFNLIGKYIQPETVIPMNIDKVTTKVFEFVLNRPFSGSVNDPSVISDISDGTASHSL